MATVTTLPDTRSRSSSARAVRGRNPLLFLALCSALAVALLGYHPYAEDGGIYASALSLRLDATLFPAYRYFVVAHTSKSLFVPLLAMLVRLGHLPQETALFALYVLSVMATLAALRQLAKVLLPSSRQQHWATVLLAVTLGMPVGGTSLYLADPYLTARSFSTPLIVLALATILQRRYGTAVVCMIASFAIHPLMTVWAVAPLAFLLLWQNSLRPMRDSALTGLGLVAAAGMLQWLLPPDSAAVRAASLSRGYWFLSQWAWYEWIGLLAPCAFLIAFVAVPRREGAFHGEARVLAGAMTAAMLTASAMSLLYIHTGNTAFLLARIQPLRLLHPVYLVFLLLLAGWIANAGREGWRSLAVYAVVLLAAAGGMLFLQRTTYPSSDHVEVPWRASGNGYVQAARWIRQNTPRDALLAADAHYTTAAGEDAQMVRAIALRSNIPDAAKDGGIASVMPALADTWMAGSNAQEGLAKATDAERIAHVKPLGASWLLLPVKAVTALHCPYENSVAKVCRIP